MRIVETSPRAYGMPVYTHAATFPVRFSRDVSPFAYGIRTDTHVATRPAVFWGPSVAVCVWDSNRYAANDTSEAYVGWLGRER